MRHPDDISLFEFRTLRSLAHGAFINSLNEQGQIPRTPEEIGHLLGDYEQFAISRDNPATLNERPDSPTQLFGTPHLLVAQRDNYTIGFGYAVNATSGSAWQRPLKMMGRSKRWAWIREIITEADAPAGLGTMIGALLLDKFNDKQPTSAYTWAENPLGARSVQSMGYERPQIQGKDEPPQIKYPFGKDAAPTELIRWTGKVGTIKAHILAKPGAQEAYTHARKKMLRR